MSERAPASPEKFESLPMPERHLSLPTAEQAEKLRPGEADPVKRLEQARTDVETHQSHDNPVERYQAAERAQTAPRAQHINQELKNITLGRELKQIRRKLKAPDRVLSKVVHQKAVRAVSEASSKTLARPSGLLGGGIVAFVGTTSYLLLTRHIGMQYNYFVFLVLFFGGFLLGLGLELAVWAFTKRNRTAD